MPDPAATRAPADAVVKQIDHVMIATNERDRLEALLSDTLGLPVAWPAAGTPRTANTLVGLALGNVILELAPRRRASPTELSNFAFQPVDLQTAPDRLTRRGLVPREPATEINDAGEKRWTTIGFRHPFAGVAFFVIQYHAFNMEERRSRFERVHRSGGGGPLGLHRVREFHLSYPAEHLPAARDSWQRLLGAPGSNSSSYFRPAAGPSIRLVEGSGPESSSVIAEVRSLSNAAAAARSLGLLLSVSRDSVVLDPRRFGGLRLVLVER
ncbi:MAG: VOC family protein [Gemmatimonadota bacterium]|nr:VOC family protein [Gemmatimonadota bacterium]